MAATAWVSAAAAEEGLMPPGIRWTGLMGVGDTTEPDTPADPVKPQWVTLDLADLFYNVPHGPYHCHFAESIEKPDFSQVKKLKFDQIETKFWPLHPTTTWFLGSYRE